MLLLNQEGVTSILTKGGVMGGDCTLMVPPPSSAMEGFLFFCFVCLRDFWISYNF